jgi:putative ABC transport system ATP-binding protein
MYELDQVSRTYKQGSREVHAVDEVSMAVKEGEFLALVGPSGSGKSTLLQLLGGMDRPTSGSVAFEGRDLVVMNDGELADLRLKTFGFVFQQFNLIPTLTASQNVEAALAPLKMKRAERHEVAMSRLEEVGLAERASHVPSELSGGEQQRVAIARALANEPRVILADEPTGNLDTKTGKEVIELLAWLCGEHGTTLVVATHDRAITRAASRTLQIEDGKTKLGRRTSRPPA